jgi:uncharacterized membrane protein
MIYLTLFLGLVLRLISINQSLWLDEATTALVSQMSLVDFFTKFMPGDFHPPFYYLVISLWSQVFGNSEITLRIPSVMFGGLTVYMVYLIAKEIKILYPLTPALFLATSGLHIYYSQEARMYSMATFLVCLIIYLYIKKKWFYFSVATAILFLTDYLSLLILSGLIIFTYFNDYKNLKKLFLSLIPLIIAFLLWLPIFTSQVSKGVALKETSSVWWNVLGPVTFKNIALIPTKFITGRVEIDNKIIYGIVIIAISFLFAYIIGRAKNKLVWSCFLSSIILGIVFSFFIPTLSYFRYLFVLPAFYLLLSETKSKAFVVLVLIINIFFTSKYLFEEKNHRENWREIANRVGSEKIVFPAMSQKEALIYYGKEKQIIRKEEVEMRDKTIWLSRYVWNVFDSSDSTRRYIENLGYNWTEELNMNGVVFWKYTKL